MSSSKRLQVLRDIPYAALQFMTFEALTKRKEVWLKNLEDARLIERTHKQYDVAISLCIGAVSETLVNAAVALFWKMRLLANLLL